jgi:RNA polymerase sigma factor (TIGR02999 family)
MVAEPTPNPHVPQDAAAFDRLFASAYDELRDIARLHLKRERAGHTLQPTALVNEAWLKLSGRPDFPVADSNAFRALVSRAMRQILIDHARARGADKRGGAAVHVTLHTDVPAAEPQPVDLLELDDALADLGRRDPRLERVVECHFFGGLSKAETAQALGVSTRTVERDWLRARAYLDQLLRAPPSAGVADADK